MTRMEVGKRYRQEGSLYALAIAPLVVRQRLHLGQVCQRQSGKASPVVPEVVDETVTC